MKTQMSSRTSVKTILIYLITVLAIGAFLSAAVPPATASFQGDIPPADQTVEGAIFSLPSSLEDEVNTYRQQTRRDLASYVFVLANSDSTYIVFDDERPRTGRATITGPSFERGISAEGFDFGVIGARSVSIETRGQQRSISKINSNPENYELELVRIDANHRRLSVINDPDQGQDITAPVSVGVLTDNPANTNDIFSQPVSKGRSLAINTSTEQLGSSSDQEVNALLGSNQDRLVTFDFEARYWSDRKETVDGIVLSLGSRAREFAITFDPTGVLSAGSDEPILYIVGDSRSSEAYTSVSSLNQNGDNGDIVSIETNLYGQSISTQEISEQNTPCGQSLAQVPDPSGPICVDILQDVVIDAGIAWTSTPETRTNLLFVAGLSSRHSDEKSSEFRGKYQITGEILSTSHFDSSLPEGKILIINQLSRTGDLSFERLPSNSQETIQTKSAQFKTSIQQQTMVSAGNINNSNKSTEQTGSSPDIGNISIKPEKLNNQSTIPKEKPRSILYRLAILICSVFILYLLRIPIRNLFYVFKNIFNRIISVNKQNNNSKIKFVASVSCGNCGNSWLCGFEAGDQIKDIESGVAVKLGNENVKRLECPVCETTNQVNIKNKKPR